MILEKLQTAHRDALVDFFRGYFGPSWRNILRARNISFAQRLAKGKLPTLSTSRQAETYAYKLGFRFASDGVTPERIPRSVCQYGSGHLARLRVNDTLLYQSRLASFRDSVSSIIKRRESLAKAGPLTGQRILQGKPGRKKAGTMPKKGGGTGGQNDPPFPLSGPRADYEAARETSKQCVNAILKRFPRWLPYLWEPDPTIYRLSLIAHRLPSPFWDSEP